MFWKHAQVDEYELSRESSNDSHEPLTNGNGEEVESQTVAPAAAYDVRTLSWLSFTRRFERLYSPIHFLLNPMVGLPWDNPRRTEHPLEQVQESVWIPDASLTEGGSFEMVTRIATNSGFCARRGLSVMKEDNDSKGFGWEHTPIPPSS